MTPSVAPEPGFNDEVSGAQIVFGIARRVPLLRILQDSLRMQRTCPDLQHKYRTHSRREYNISRVPSARQSAEEARVEAQGALKEIQEAKKIAAGKAFSMQSKYVKKYISY